VIAKTYDKLILSILLTKQIISYFGG